MNKEEIALRLTELYGKHHNIITERETRFTDIYNIMLENINDYKDKELQARIDKAIEYIHNHQPVFELSSKEQIQEWFEKEYYVELLKILKGE